MDLLQTATGDLAVTNNTLTFVTGADEVKQRLTQRLRTFLGEWFLDQSRGIPYFQEIMKKNPSSTIVEAIFKNEILGTPGVLAIEYFKITVDNVTRRLYLELKVQAVDGLIELEVTP